MLSKLFNGGFMLSKAERRARQYRDLIRREAEIGGQLFGPIPKNGRREFFCLDPNTWVWHEEWDDEEGVHHAVTTRYDIRKDGIFKAQDGQPYERLSISEGRRFYKAAHMYRDSIHAQLYNNL